MMKLISVLIVVLTIGPAFPPDPGPGEEQVAIIHFDRLTEAKLEGSAKDLTFLPSPGAPWQTPYIRLTNDLLTPRKITLRILGLTEPEYDLYVFDVRKQRNIKPIAPNNPPSGPVFLDPRDHYVGKKTKDELESGVELSFPGTFMPSDYGEYFSRVKSRCLERARLYATATTGDAEVCRVVLSTTPKWMDAMSEGDRRLRTLSVVVSPAGKSFSLPGGGIPAQSPDFSAAVKRLGYNLQLVRRDVAKLVKNPLYLYDTEEALTPVDFKLVPPADVKPAAKVTIRAIFMNWTDRAISGTVSVILPAGWKTAKPSAAVKLPAFSKNVEARFAVTLPKALKADNVISATANLKVGTVTVKLQAKAEK